MACLAMGQAGLVEALLPAAFGSSQRLERIRLQVDRVPIELLLQPMRRAPTGRPAYPPLVQLEALLLQHLRLDSPRSQPRRALVDQTEGVARHRHAQREEGHILHGCPLPCPFS
jgi:hypothetical protein